MFALPATTPELLRDDARPYFLWWTDVSVGQLRTLLGSPDPDTRAYYLGALCREANTRDVWSFVTPDELRRDWPLILRHLGRTRAMWAYLLGLEPSAAVWPPVESRGA